MKILHVIPARGGSKGIPRKNIALVGGKPLIAWTIEAVSRGAWGGRVVVSTDDEEIASVAREWKAEVPFLRPGELALDTTPGVEPPLHALDRLAADEGYEPDLVVLLQPTSPLRTAEDITGAIRVAIEHEADAVVSVTPVEKHPHWMKAMTADGRLRPLLSDVAAATHRQALPLAFSPNGAIYVARPDVLKRSRGWQTDRTYAWVMPPERSLDIDTPFDLELADLLLRKRPRETMTLGGA